MRQLAEQEQQTIEAKLKQRRWYRQRFDACPHFLGFVADAHVCAVWRSPFPFGQRDAWVMYRRDVADWHHDHSQLRRTAASFLSQIRREARLLAQMKRYYAAAYRRFLKICDTLERTNLQGLSDAGLLAAYNRLAEAYTPQLTASPLIDGFTLTTDETIASALGRHLTMKSKGSCFPEVFSALTAPVHLSFAQQEEIDLLRTRGTEAALRRHQIRYRWIANNYVQDSIPPVTAFASRLKRLERKGISPARIKELPRRNLLAKCSLMRELQLPERLRRLILLTDLFNEWQDWRKHSSLLATRHFSALLEELGRRTGYSLEELRYSLPAEIPAVFEKGLPPAELKRRFAGSLVIYNTRRIIMSTEPGLLMRLEAGDGPDESLSELRGLPACPGVVSGFARVIRTSKEAEKVLHGEVLVTVMTRPDYIDAVHKASAIVTDEGGVTSHAANIARELGKPCVIGTKSATRSLKDGDLVLVDANNGIVRVLERA